MKTPKRRNRGSFRVVFFTFFALLGGVVAVFLIQRKETPKTTTEASVGQQFTISSLDEIPSLASKFSVGQSFTVKIPGWLYKQVYVASATAYCTTQTTMCGEPFDTTFIGPQNIWSTFAYGSPYERKPVGFNYYYFVGSGAIVKAQVTKCTISGKNCSNAEKGTIQLAMDQIALRAWYIYRQLVQPVTIRNDKSYLYLTFKVLAR